MATAGTVAADVPQPRPDWQGLARRSWRAVDFVFGYTGLTKDADYRLATVDASFYALNYAKHRVTLAATLHLAEGLELRLDNSARWQAANLLRTLGGDRALLTSAAPLSEQRFRMIGILDIQTPIVTADMTGDEFVLMVNAHPLGIRLHGHALTRILRRH